MVWRNTTKTKRSREGLSPCRRPVDAAATKTALSAFIATCRTTAVVATVTLAACAPGRLSGAPCPGEIKTLEADPQPTAQPVPTPGGIKALKVMPDNVRGGKPMQRIEEE